MSKLFNFDKKHKLAKYLIGTDEAGRGPLAGPVVAAAVHFPQSDKSVLKELELINDSKKLLPKHREVLYEIIKKHAIYSITEISVEEIEKINILQSALKAMKISCEYVIKQLNETDIEVYVDGNKRIPNFKYIQTPIVKGDGTSASVAAASILAKVYRDKIMDKYAIKYPNYDFENNKGYGTQKHVHAILEHGITPIHRKSFLKKILNNDTETQLTIEF